MRYDIAEQTVYLYGAATVKYGDVEMTADRIVFYFKNEETQAFGAPDSPEPWWASRSSPRMDP